VRTAAPREFFPLCVGYWDCLWRLREAIPDFLEQAQPVRDSERSDIRAYGAHDRILHFSFRSCKLRLSTGNAHHRAAWLQAASSAFCVSLSLVTVFARVPDIGKRLIEVWRHVSGPRQRVPDESRPPRVQRLLCPPRGNGL
jgi:hypothetical protein